MSLENELDSIFESMLAKRGTKRMRAAFRQRVGGGDVCMLLDKIAAIGDPADYCNDQETYAPVQPFFEFVDYVSGLIIEMGAEVWPKVSEYPDQASKYIPWVKKYVLDERFHHDLLEKLP